MDRIAHITAFVISVVVVVVIYFRPYILWAPLDIRQYGPPGCVWEKGYNTTLAFATFTPASSEPKRWK